MIADPILARFREELVPPRTASGRSHISIVNGVSAVPCRSSAPAHRRRGRSRPRRRTRHSAVKSPPACSARGPPATWSRCCWPASRASAVSVCAPSDAAVVFHCCVYGAVLSAAPSDTPSSLNCDADDANVVARGGLERDQPGDEGPPRLAMATVGACASLGITSASEVSSAPPPAGCSASCSPSPRIGTACLRARPVRVTV